MKIYMATAVVCIAVVAASGPTYAKSDKNKASGDNRESSAVASPAKSESAIVKCGAFTGSDKSFSWERPATVVFSGNTISFKRNMMKDEAETWTGVKANSGKILLVGSGGKNNGSNTWVMEFAGDYQKDKTVLKGRYTNVAGISGYRECDITFQ